jgi:murein DD-endopeptidase MepM/ murein hydrolase activator NlpD
VNNSKVLRWISQWFRPRNDVAAPTLTEGLADEPIYELPFEVGARSRVIQGYGGSYSHTGDAHYSIDFQMPEGTAVCAARAGVVFHVVNHFLEGGTDLSFKNKANSINILHPDDSIATYAHIAHRGNRVCAGNAVTAGQLIGYSGNTGWSGTPHLHFHVADAIDHKGIATKFITVENGVAALSNKAWYTRPVTKARIAAGETHGAQAAVLNSERNAFAFSTELLELAAEVEDELALAGYDKGSGYVSINALHDIHGLEVCGIASADETLEITRFLLRRFRGWNAGWINAPVGSSSQGWVARIRRDRDADAECWQVE